MPGNLSFESLKAMAAAGTVDTVLICAVDMQGRLMGKRFHVQNFIDSSHEETHCCNYVLATDLEMSTPDGYASTSWRAGYGDYVMKPDLSTMRLVPWAEDPTGQIIHDCYTRDGEPHPLASRNVLKRVLALYAAEGWKPVVAPEVEFYLVQKNIDPDYELEPPVGRSGRTASGPVTAGASRSSARASSAATPSSPGSARTCTWHPSGTRSLGRPG